MFLPIFTVCILIEVSKGDTNGMGLATWNRFSLEQERKRTEEAAKYEIVPRIDWTGGKLPYKALTTASARNVVGYGSILYSRGKETKRLAVGKSKSAINMPVAILVNESDRTDTRMEREVLTKKRKNMKRSRVADNERTETVGNAKETAIIPKNKNSGRKKTEKAVRSANMLATRKPLGVTDEVKIRLCSYSNTTYPLKLEMRVIATTPEIKADRESRWTIRFIPSLTRLATAIDMPMLPGVMPNM